MTAPDDNVTGQNELAPKDGCPPLQEQYQEIAFREALAQHAQQIEALRTDVLGQEHRFLSVLENAWLALRPRDGWTSAMRRAAVFALIRYFISPRVAVVISLGLGGLATALLAWQANLLFEEQNQKIELQSHLDIASVYADYAQRNAQLLQSAQPLLESIGGDAPPLKKVN